MSQPTDSYEAARLNRSIGGWLLQEDEGFPLLEKEILPKWLPSRRWFGGKARTMERVAIDAAIPLGDNGHVLIVAVNYAGHAPDRYVVPLAWGAAAEFDGEAGIVARGDGDVVLSDALFSPAFRQRLLQLIASGGTLGTAEKGIIGRGSKYLTALAPHTLQESRILGVEQSNTSVIYGGRLFLKLFRRLDVGINPDAEIMRFLSEKQGFGAVPPYAGELEARLGGESFPLGLMLGAVENRGDAWAWALGALAKYYEGLDSNETMERIAQLGRHTAAMHRALSDDPMDAAFSPEPLTSADFDELANSVSARLDALLPTLRSRDAAGDTLAGQVLGEEASLRLAIAELRKLPPGASKTRHHGDYHLGQVLDTGTDWMIIDFEGEPTRSLAERRQKRSPLRDVAGMLRSFHYAAHSACPSTETEAQQRAEEWADDASTAFLNSYLESAEGARFLPQETRDRAALLRAYVLEKALYEIDYELNNRPDWLPIPLRGILRALRN